MHVAGGVCPIDLVHPPMYEFPMSGGAYVAMILANRLMEIEDLLNGSSCFGGGGFDVGEVCCTQSNMDNR